MILVPSFDIPSGFQTWKNQRGVSIPGSSLLWVSQSFISKFHHQKAFTSNPVEFVIFNPYVPLFRKVIRGRNKMIFSLLPPLLQMTIEKYISEK